MMIVSPKKNLSSEDLTCHEFSQEKKLPFDRSDPSRIPIRKSASNLVEGADIQPQNGPVGAQEASDKESTSNQSASIISSDGESRQTPSVSSSDNDGDSSEIQSRSTARQGIRFRYYNDFIYSLPQEEELNVHTLQDTSINGNLVASVGSENADAGPGHEAKKNGSSKLDNKSNPELLNSVSQGIGNEEKLSAVTVNDNRLQKPTSNSNTEVQVDESKHSSPVCATQQSSSQSAEGIIKESAGSIKYDNALPVSSKDSNESFDGTHSQATLNTVSESKSVDLNTGAESTDSSDGEDKQTLVQQEPTIVPKESEGLTIQTPPVKDAELSGNQASTSNDQTTSQQESVMSMFNFRMPSVGNGTSRALYVATSNAQQVVPRGGTVSAIEVLKNLPNNEISDIGILFSNDRSFALIFKKSDRKVGLLFSSGNTYRPDLHLINKESLEVLLNKKNLVLANDTNNFSTVETSILEQKSDTRTNGKKYAGGIIASSVQPIAPESLDGNSGKKDPQPTVVTLVANKDSKRVSNAQGNSKQTSYPNKNNPTPQNARSKLPAIAASMLAITGVVSGIAIAVYLEMLAVGIAVGACCLVAAAIVYYCNQPSNSLEKSSAEAVAATIGTP